MPIDIDVVSDCLLHVNHATALSVMVNELVTTGIKHGGGTVKVSPGNEEGMLSIGIIFAGGWRPEDFSIVAATGFGLRSVRSMLSGLGGSIRARNLVKEDTVFSVGIPVASLQKP